MIGFAGFIRNKMSARYASNTKCSRLKVDVEDINSFFNELEKTLQEAGIEELIPEYQRTFTIMMRQIL